MSNQWPDLWDQVKFIEKKIKKNHKTPISTHLILKVEIKERN
jgi:hypothetical protein